MRNLIKYLRIVFSVILIYVILTKVDLGEVIGLFHQIKLHYLVPILLFFVFEKVVEAYKWNLLLRAKHIYIPFMEMFKITYIGSFLGFALPSAISVDFIRGYGLYKHLSGKEESISSVIVDRVLSLSVLTTLAVVSILLSSIYTTIDKDIMRSILLLLAVFLTLWILLIVVALVRQNTIWEMIENRFRKLKTNVIWIKVKKLHRSLQEYKVHRLTLLKVSALSVAINVSRILLFYLVSLCLGLKIPLIYFFIFVPAIQLITRLPISIGGIGVREGGFVYFFSKVGFPYSQTFAIPFLVSILVIVSILPGGIIYATAGFSSHRDQASRAAQDGVPK